MLDPFIDIGSRFAADLTDLCLVVLVSSIVLEIAVVGGLTSSSDLAAERASRAGARYGFRM
jgi:hypothetical protein